MYSIAVDQSASEQGREGASRAKKECKDMATSPKLRMFNINNKIKQKFSCVDATFVLKDVQLATQSHLC